MAQGIGTLRRIVQAERERRAENIDGVFTFSEHKSTSNAVEVTPEAMTSASAAAINRLAKPVIKVVNDLGCYAVYMGSEVVRTYRNGARALTVALDLGLGTWRYSGALSRF